jgi:hypothetical protein
MNIDKLHFEWMENYKTLAMEILGPCDAKAHVICCSDSPVQDPITGMEYDYTYDGDLQLPRDSAEVIELMAKFSQSYLSNPPSIKGFDKFKEYPVNTFNLRSLIVAAYPRHIETEIFKGDNIGIFVLAGEEDLDDGAFFVAFGGLGVMLMEKLRQLLGEALTDEEIVELTTDRYLVFETGSEE